MARFTCFLLFPVCCWPRGGPHRLASPGSFPFPVLSASFPLPCPLLWSLISSPNPSPHFLTHPSDLSVATLPCPPLLSPLSDRCPLFSGIPGFLCLLFHEVRAEPLAAPS